MNNSTAKTCIIQMKKLINDIRVSDAEIGNVITDNGTQFISHEWKNFLASESIKHTHVAPYSPQASSAERTMREIATKFRLYLNSEEENNHERWATEINQINKCINETPNQYGLTPNQIWGIQEPEKDGRFAKIGIKANQFNTITSLKQELGKLQKQYIINHTSSKKILQAPYTLQPNDLIYDCKDNALVTVDGACRNNGGKAASASIGICFAPESNINIAL